MLCPVKLFFIQMTLNFSCWDRETHILFQANEMKAMTKEWLVINLLKINYSKTELILVDVRMSSSENRTIQLLEDHIGQRLSWFEYLNTLCSKLNRACLLLTKPTDLLLHLRNLHLQ